MSHKQLKLFLAVAVTLMFGCAKEEFVRQQYSASASAAGFRTLPAKVDIVMVPDNTGSINSGYSSVVSQLSGFASSLQSQEWDFHLMRSLISNPSAINRALVNPKFNGPTLPDGTPNLNGDWVPAQYAVTEASQFPLLTSSDINPGSGSIDSTMSNSYSIIDQAVNSGNHFIRPDAMLAVIIITNGVDGNLLTNPNDAFSSVDNNKISYWAGWFKNFKTRFGFSAELVRFYTISSPNYMSSGCYGGSAFSGLGYSNFISLGHFKGFSRNFCDPNAISGVLNSIAADLQTTKQAFVYSNIVLPNKPVASSIKVFKNGIEVPNNASNGWTYGGDAVQTVYTITGIMTSTGQIQPFYSNAQTGYVISLHGSAVLTGNDQPSIQYERQ